MQTIDEKQRQSDKMRGNKRNLIIFGVKTAEIMFEKFRLL
jgi:hypothetical protein